jgi:hypothetical protein
MGSQACLVAELVKQPTKTMAVSTAPSSTVIVRIPMRFQRRGGRKRIVTPDAARSR